MGRLLAVVHCDDVIAAETRAAGTRKLRPFHGRVMHHQPGYVIHVQHVTPALADLISLIDKGLLQKLCHTLPAQATVCYTQKGSKFVHLPPVQAALRCSQYTQQQKRVWRRCELCTG